MEYAIAWWVTLEVLGLLALPYLFWAFPQLPDRGLAFAKSAGALLTGYVLWLIGTSHLVPVGRGGVVLATVVVAVGALWLAKREGPAFARFIRQAKSTIIVYEVVFAVAFFLWAFVRAFNPQIEGTEKPMDYALMNASMLSTSYPPNDPWLSGYPVNYYYFGYLLAGALTLLSGVPAPVGYNLALAFLFAATVTSVWGLVANAVTVFSLRAAVGSLLPRFAHAFGGFGAFLVLGIGNLEGVLEFVRAHGFNSQALYSWLAIKKDFDPAANTWRFLGVTPFDPPYNSAAWYPDESWWWWRATRVIDTIAGGQSVDYTITEFPFFSFLLSDMHPHVMALPFAVLALALVMQALLRPGQTSGKLDEGWVQRCLPPAFALGALGFINGWDLGPYLALYVAAIAIGAWRSGVFGQQFKHVVIAAAAVSIGAVLLYAPFYLALGWNVISALTTPQAGGAVKGFPVALWTGPGTRPIYLLLLWAPFFSLITILLVGIARRVAPRVVLPWVAALVAGIVIAWGVLEFSAAAGGSADVPMGIAVLQRTWYILPIIATLALLEATIAHARQDSDSIPLLFPLLLASGAIILLAFAESFYIKDVFSNRMNTVFKLSYQAWLWLAVGGAIGAFMVWQTGLFRSWPRRISMSLVAVLLLGSALYVPASLFGKTNGFRGPANLDGTASVAARDTGELEAVRWLMQQPDKRSGAVLEATGPEYSQYGRISTDTGIPTVLGWAGHELQWRGSDAAYRNRTGDIDTIYKTADKTRVVPLLKQYGVTYVFVGNLERSKYGPELNTFNDAFPVAFKNDSVTIYRVPNT